jgi:hypothetical protein
MIVRFIKLATLMFLLPCLFLGALCPGVIAQIPNKELTKDQLKGDFRILRYTFERAHPALYRYTPKEQMDQAFDRAETKLNRPMHELEFFRMLAPLIDLIHDAHTQILPSGAVRSYIGKLGKVFPLDVRYIGTRAFVEKNFSENKAISLGAEILSINGIPMSEITEKVLTAKSTDGFNRVPKYEVAHVNFWLNYFLMVDTSESFRIEARDPQSGKTAQYSTPGIQASVIINGQFKVQKHDTFSLDFIEDGQVALMSIPNFGDDLTLIDRYADAFGKIKEKGVRTLIIDIRDNGGGLNELNTELLTYLVPHPFRFYKGATYRAKSWDDLKYVEYSADDFLNEPDFKRFSEAERKQMVKGMTLPEVLEHNWQTDPAGGVHQPKPNPFSGDLYLLFNGRSQSSGGEIPALMHFLGVGTLIGEEPNAAYQGTSGGVILRLVLPNSKIGISFPLLAFENAVLPGLFVAHGAPPHFVVGETLEDAISGQDTAFEFTLELIRARLSNKQPGI